MGSPQIPQTYAVTVAAGTGTATATLSSGGLCVAIGIKAPSGAATYDIELVDDDGFGITGRTGNTGNTKITADFHSFGPVTINITNATAGAYSVKFWYRK